MRIHLGRAGENLAQQVVWPGIVEEYEKLYGPGRFELAVQREGDAAPYPAVIEQGEKDVAWTITNADTAKVGEGSCELSYFVGEALAKTQTWRTLTLPSLTGGEMAPPPEPEAAWVEMVLSAGAAAEESREAAETARLAAETAQEAAEVARENAEDAREKAETARESAEKSSQQAETAREKAEFAREIAVDAREKAEAANTAAQEARNKAEQSQAVAEEAKASAARDAEAAGQSRQAAETASASAELSSASAVSSATAAETARTGAEAAETASRKIYGDIVELTNYTDEQMVETMAECGIIQPVGAGGESLYGASDLVYLF